MDLDYQKADTYRGTHFESHVGGHVYSRGIESPGKDNLGVLTKTTQKCSTFTIPKKKVTIVQIVELAPVQCCTQ